MGLLGRLLKKEKSADTGDIDYGQNSGQPPSDSLSPSDGQLQEDDLSAAQDKSELDKNLDKGISNPTPTGASPAMIRAADVENNDFVMLRRVLSHNIRMPMAVIAGYGDLIINAGLNEEDIREYVIKICKNITYMDSVLKIFLDGASEEEIEKKEWFDLLLATKEICNYVKSLTSKAGITVAINSGGETIPFFGSRVLIMRAFYNLVENSIKYMKREGNIIFTLEDMGNSILVVYRDDGEGMLEEELSHITELSFRGSNVSGGGCGVGMYLVKEAVEKNGGSLEVSSGRGKGMTVYMTFEKK